MRYPISGETPVPSPVCNDIPRLGHWMSVKNIIPAQCGRDGAVKVIGAPVESYCVVPGIFGFDRDKLRVKDSRIFFKQFVPAPTSISGGIPRTHVVPNPSRKLEELHKHKTKQGTMQPRPVKHAKKIQAEYKRNVQSSDVCRRKTRRVKCKESEDERSHYINGKQNQGMEFPAPYPDDHKLSQCNSQYEIIDHQVT